MKQTLIFIFAVMLWLFALVVIDEDNVCGNFKNINCVEDIKNE